MKHTGTSHNGRRLRVSAAILVAATLGYALGSLTVYQRLFPFEQIQTLKTAIFGSSLMEPTPRNELFRAFSPKADVVMIGDSITSAGEWSEIFPDVKISNRGISGETAEDILHRMDTIFAVDPDKAFIMVGINDIYDAQSVDAILKNYIEIVEQLRARNITVYIQSTVECSIDTCGNRINKVRDLNQRLKTYADEQHITYINLNERLATDSKGLLSKYTYDGMHLGAQGFMQWKEMIRSYIQQDFKKP